MSSDHFFDWEGFQSLGNILWVIVAIGLAAHFTLVYVAESRSTPLVAATSSLAAVVEAETLPSLAEDTTINFSTTTSERIINMLAITDAVPPMGKFIAADLVHMRIMLYQDGILVAEYPILAKGTPGSPSETPSGFYTVLSKEQDHFNRGEQVHLPWSMQFYGNYFIHGWPYFLDGALVDPDYSGGCIRLDTDNAKKVYDFSDKGTHMFVYDSIHTTLLSSLVLDTIPAPTVSAGSYLVADVDTGDVFLEQNVKNPLPIASVTKLMTALVANETIMSYKKVAVSRNELLGMHSTSTTATAREQFPVADLLYPLLMASNSVVADRLAHYYGTGSFINWMNATAKSLDMQSTHFTDASGVSTGNVSTPDDLYRLTTYIANNKSFIFDITRTPLKKLISDKGNVYEVNNANVFFESANFIGGKIGSMGGAEDTMVSLFLVPVNGVARRIAVIVFKSSEYTSDTLKLADWLRQSAQQGAAMVGTACTSCTTASHYRKIQL